MRANLRREGDIARLVEAADKIARLEHGGENRGRIGWVGAQITIAQIVRGKFDLDVVGHYARPDIFQLQVDERSKKPVITQGAD